MVCSLLCKGELEKGRMMQLGRRWRKSTIIGTRSIKFFGDFLKVIYWIIYHEVLEGHEDFGLLKLGRYVGDGPFDELRTGWCEVAEALALGVIGFVGGLVGVGVFWDGLGSARGAFGLIMVDCLLII